MSQLTRAFYQLAAAIKQAEDDTDPDQKPGTEKNLSQAINITQEELRAVLNGISINVAEKFRPVFDELRADIWERKYGVRYGSPKVQVEEEFANTSQIKLSKTGNFSFSLMSEHRAQIVSGLKYLLAGGAGAFLREVGPRIYHFFGG